MNNVKDEVRNGHYHNIFMNTVFLSVPIHIRAAVSKTITHSVNSKHYYNSVVLEFEEVYGVKS